MTRLSGDEARRIALAAQGFDRPRPARVDLAAVRRTVARLGLVQLDYVNVVGPAHYHVLWSRLGSYRRELLDELAYVRRELTEQWAHEAALVPVATWPLLRHRRDAHRLRPSGFEAEMARHADYAAWVLDEVRRRGPISAEQLPGPEGRSRRLDEAWFGTMPRAVLEAHFGRGVLAVASRGDDRARSFDLAERLIPAAHHDVVMTREDAERALLRDAARAHGVGTAADLADYYRMRVTPAKARLAELVAAGELRTVRVDGWRELAYLDPAARSKPIAASALLSPFDPLIWYRPRTERLFGFEYRFEIFTPAAKRRWGTYVLPFLLGDRLVARVDLKAERDAGRLRVVAAYRERGTEDQVATALATELRALATWHGLDEVRVGRRGDLSRALAAALRS